MAEEEGEEQAVLSRSRLRRRWQARSPAFLRLNNLSPAVGLLELSNALDFAANAWNSIPPPAIAMAFMALGATGALVILLFAAFDFPRAMRNTLILRQERRQLSKRCRDAEKDAAPLDDLTERDVQIYLDMNSREMGNEVIDRIGMVILLGFGALTVGVGTYMAIDGANAAVFLASNIITGYVGNVPAALYGLFNATWCVYGWMRAQRHTKAALNYLQNDHRNDDNTALIDSIKRHTNRVKSHAIINGISGIAGGAGSLMTASTYIKPVGIYGYFILLPTAISAFAVNVFWRRSVNYERTVAILSPVDVEQVMSDSVYAVKSERLISAYRSNVHDRAKSKFSHKKAFDQTALCTFMIDLRALTLEQATQDLQRIATESFSSEDKESSKQEQTASNDGSLLSGEQERLQAKVDRLNASLTRLRLTPSDSEKQVEPDELLDVSYDALLSFSLFSTLCEKLANSNDFNLPLLASSQDGPKTNGVLRVKSSALLQQIKSECASKRSTVTFLKLASELLASRGVKQAQDRVRYYSEFCGCVLSCCPLEPKMKNARGKVQGIATKQAESQEITTNSDEALHTASTSPQPDD